MRKTLGKTGNSRTLVINKEMIAHLGLEGDEVEVGYREGSIVLSNPDKRMTFEVAAAATHRQFGNALRNLAE